VKFKLVLASIVGTIMTIVAVFLQGGASAKNKIKFKLSETARKREAESYDALREGLKREHLASKRKITDTRDDFE